MNLLKKFIAIKGYTGKRAAKELAVAENTLSLWMRGKSKPRAQMAYKIQLWSKGFIPMEYWENAESEIQKQ